MAVFLNALLWYNITSFVLKYFIFLLMSIDDDSKCFSNVAVLRSYHLNVQAMITIWLHGHL